MNSQAYRVKEEKFRGDIKLTAIILALNEEMHLSRCITSLTGVASEVLVVDSFSRDSTLEIANSHRVRVVQHKFINHANQFNWALTQLSTGVEWVLRIDADEYLTQQLASEIRDQLGRLNSAVDGIYCSRRIIFQGRLIRHGGIFPVRVLRIFRATRGHCENRWMDEHIKVLGDTVEFAGDIIDDNLNTLTWWTEKHNQYASREAVDLLNLEYRFAAQDTIANLTKFQQAGVKRWLKERVYAKLAPGFRAFAYFLYRYVIRLGFLDGQSGTAFHFLQGFWYRYLVDAKVAEVKRFMRERNVGVVFAVEKILGIKI